MRYDRRIMLAIPDTKGFAYESMGTQWRVSIWDAIGDDKLAGLEKKIIERSNAFDVLYSRFKKISLIWQLASTTGVTEVPQDLVAMLRLYERLHDLSGGACNPLVGFALSDLGYDAEYSLKAKESIRPVPDFHDAVRIIDDTHIDMKQPALIDVGALGKGYFVDRVTDVLKENGIRRFLVDGSGDIYYRGDEPIRAGLEHPGDPTKVIGVATMTEGAMCASSGNRRKWGAMNHIIDPHTLASPEIVIATWVIAPYAALADGLATCLFFSEPERYAELPFEYCVLNKEYRVKRSDGFVAELF